MVVMIQHPRIYLACILISESRLEGVNRQI
jgi:hypothetical protein